MYMRLPHTIQTTDRGANHNNIICLQAKEYVGGASSCIVYVACSNLICTGFSISLRFFFIFFALPSQTENKLSIFFFSFIPNPTPPPVHPSCMRGMVCVCVCVSYAPPDRVEIIKMK